MIPSKLIANSTRSFGLWLGPSSNSRPLAEKDEAFSRAIDRLDSVASWSTLPRFTP